MGVTVLNVAIASLANPDVTERLEFIVDSGAVYSGRSRWSRSAFRSTPSDESSSRWI